MSRLKEPVIDHRVIKSMKRTTGSVDGPCRGGWLWLVQNPWGFRPKLPKPAPSGAIETHLNANAINANAINANTVNANTDNANAVY
jgi:hypothetical protein